MKPEYIAMIWIAGASLLGIIFGVVAFIVSYSSKRKESVCTHNVNATIVDVVEQYTMNVSGPRTYRWFPVYEYTFNSKVIRKMANIGGYEEDYKIGSTVTLLVNPDNPEQFCGVTENKVTRILVITFISVSVVLITVSCFLSYLIFFRK